MVERILLVQWHYHTKSCKKHGNNKCRFGIPRFPSDFTIITQPIPEEIAKIEEETMRSINFLKIKFETELKIIESTVVEMKKIYGFAHIDETLNSWLEKIIPKVIITEDEEFIIVNNNETEFKLRTIMISNAWQQNPNYNEF